MADDTAVYWSMDALADAVTGKPYADSKHGDSWSGDVTGAEALELARKGWNAQLKAALSIAESAVSMAEKEQLMESFNQPVWDVTGAQVDVGAYLAGTPECMVDYPLTETSKVGRIVTLCASMSYSGSISADVIRKRGQNIVALALALSRLGHNTELWMDLTGRSGKGTVKLRVLVKGANDELDPSKVMFAFAHPAMLRILGFAGIGLMGYSPVGTRPIAPEQDLPEGTIYLPEVCSGSNIPNADEFLRKYLGELGLLAE